METLRTHGVAVIPLLNETECREMVRGMWDTLESLTGKWETPMNRNKMESWRGIRDLFPKHSMLIQNWGIGHAPFIWNLRENPKCLEVFSKLWSCAPDELLVSFDGASFHMPSEATNIGWRRKVTFHCDQSYQRNAFECVQSWVTGCDVNEGDATLAYYEGSHLLHGEFAKAFPEAVTRENWLQLEPNHETFYSDRCEKKFITCPKGSMVLWDSRTIHCGVEPVKGRENPNIRCVVYLCYTPRSLSNKKELEKKQKAFTEKRMTTHWPHKVRLFPKMPRTYGAPVKEMTELPSPVLSPLGRKLAGF